MLGKKNSVFLYLRKKQAISELTYGTKFHLNVRSDQVADAWDCIEDLLVCDDSPFDSFKVIDTSETYDGDDEKERQRMERITQGMQFTFYVHAQATQPQMPEAKLKAIATLFHSIETRLTAAGIEPGIIPEPDHQLSRYISSRYAANGNVYTEGLGSKGEHNWRAKREIEFIAEHNGWPIKPIPEYDETASLSFHHLLDWFESLTQSSRHWMNSSRLQSQLAQRRLVIETIVTSHDQSITPFERLAVLAHESLTALEYDDYLTQNSYEHMTINLLYSDETLKISIKTATEAVHPYHNQLARLYSAKIMRQHIQIACDDFDTNPLADMQFREKLFFPPYLYYYIECSASADLDDLTRQFVKGCSEKSFAIDVIRVSLRLGKDPKLAQMVEGAPAIKELVFKREQEVVDDDSATELMKIISKQVENTKADETLAMTRETTELMGPGHPF
ncbi:MAG: hypothetical protein P1U40_04535 [Coxiellaceae bacterium]|nr:hypothetical protein [Coxiellaceae bacterium]